MAWKYKYVEYTGPYDVSLGLSDCKNLEDAMAMLKAYCDEYSNGEANLRYFMGGSPKHILFFKHHVLSAKLTELNNEIKKIEKKILEDYEGWEKGL